MDDCTECGFVYDDIPRRELPLQLRSVAAGYAPELHAAEDAGLARSRPQPATWSALEYTCHVLDVYRAQRERLRRAVTEEVPDYPAATVHRDERVVRDRYNEADVDAVLADLYRAAEEMASALEDLDDDAWERTGVYHRPDPQERTVEWTARKTLHEAVHHFMDVKRDVAQLRGAPA